MSTLKLQDLSMRSERQELLLKLTKERRKLYLEHTEDSTSYNRYNKWATEYEPVRDEILELLTQILEQLASETGNDNQHVIISFFERAAYFVDLLAIENYTTDISTLKMYLTAAIHITSLSMPDFSCLSCFHDGIVELTTDVINIAASMIECTDGSIRPGSIFTLAELYRGALFLDSETVSGASIIKRGIKRGKTIDFFEALAVHGAFTISDKDTKPGFTIDVEHIDTFAEQAFAFYDILSPPDPKVHQDWIDLLYLIPRDWDLWRLEPHVIIVATIEAVRKTHGLPSCLPILGQTLDWWTSEDTKHPKRQEFDAALTKCIFILGELQTSSIEIHEETNL